MDKRYQVFVSSTYADLKEERQHVIQALMEMDCIPAGMELFPAADEEQWEFIKKVIDDCDYYLLIIGGRYGSTTDDGISYTEKEFDYAVQKQLKIVALIHGSPDNIPFGKSEKNPELREKLSNFKDKVMNGRLVKFWTKASELPGLVALSMTKTIKMYPAVGWIRANRIASENLLQEINELRKENLSLKDSALLNNTKGESNRFDDIADMENKFIIHAIYSSYHSTQELNFKKAFTWNKIFALISPYLLEYPTTKKVKEKLVDSIKNMEKISSSYFIIDDQDFKTITIQLKAYGLVKTEYSKTPPSGLFWSLTTKGEKLMYESRIIRNS